jgi:hypothetical protein
MNEEEIDEAVLAGRITPQIREAQSGRYVWWQHHTDDFLNLLDLLLKAEAYMDHAPICRDPNRCDCGFEQIKQKVDAALENRAAENALIKQNRERV